MDARNKSRTGPRAKGAAPNKQRVGVVVRGWQPCDLAYRALCSQSPTPHTPRPSIDAKSEDETHQAALRERWPGQARQVNCSVRSGSEKVAVRPTVLAKDVQCGAGMDMQKSASYLYARRGQARELTPKTVFYRTVNESVAEP